MSLFLATSLFPAVALADSLLETVPLNSATGAVGAATQPHSWPVAPAGWSFVREYHSSGNSFVVMLRQFTGELEIRHLDASGVGSVARTYHLRSRWTAADVVYDGGAPSLVLHDAPTGRIRTYSLGADGSLGSSSESESTAWEDRDLFKAFESGGDSYFFGYNRWTGGYVVYNVDGSPAATGGWTGGWSSVDFTEIDGEAYRLLYKYSDAPGSQGGRLRIDRIAPNFSVEEEVFDGYIETNWSTVKFALTPTSAGGDGGVVLNPPAGPFVFAYAASTGDYEVRSFDGGLGPITASGQIDAAWTDVELYSYGDFIYAALLNEEEVVPVSGDQVQAMADSIAFDLVDNCLNPAQGVTGCTPAYQVAISQMGRTLYRDAWGLMNFASGTPMTEDTVVSLASGSKVITSLSVLKMIDWGEIDLDAPAVNYLDYDSVYTYSDLHPSARYMTVRDFLSHTTGRTASDADGSSYKCTQVLGVRMNCTPFLSRATECGSAATIDDGTATLCPQNPAIGNANARLGLRNYENSNTAVLRSIVEAERPVQDVPALVDRTYALWLGRLNAEGADCLDPGEGMTYYDGCGGDNSTAPCPVSGMTTVPQTDSSSCSSGGWKFTANAMLEVSRGLQYGWLLGPELTNVVRTPATAPAGGSTWIIWDSIAGSAAGPMNGKNGGTDYVDTQLYLGGNSPVDLRIDAALISTTMLDAPSDGTGLMPGSPAAVLLNAIGATP